MSGRKQLIRDFEATRYLDLFLVSAISAVLLIRFGLFVTGYPQVGGSSLHIAHMLWGGLLMLVALVVALSFLGRRARQIAALCGGLGFGTFIDEVGKFVTRDHDYFYRPALALIYLSFVLTYLAIRSIHRARSASADEYLVNALQELENVVLDDLDPHERDRALRYLERADRGDPLVVALGEVLQRTRLVPAPEPHPLARLRRALIRLYRDLTAHPRFPRAVAWIFALRLALEAASVVAVLAWPDYRIRIPPAPPPGLPDPSPLGVIDWIELSSTALSGAFVARGILRLRASRARAYRSFQRSLLVSILVTQPFAFYADQWVALIGLGGNLALLAALNFALDQESAGRDPR